MDIWTDRPYLVVVASCEGIKCRRTKGQRSLRTPVISDRTANENVWALRDFRYAGDSTGSQASKDGKEEGLVLTVRVVVRMRQTIRISYRITHRNLVKNAE